MLLSHRMGRDVQLIAAAENRPALKSGMRGGGVTILQDILVDLRIPMPLSTRQGSLAGDGIYGAETTEAVRRFQRQHGLTPDGVAGRMTLHKLDEIVRQTPNLDTADPTIATIRLASQMQDRNRSPFDHT